MQPTEPTTVSTLTHARWATILAVVASLPLAPCLFAQTPTPAPREPSSQTSPERNPAREKLYSLKFEGPRETWDLNYALREQLSAENVVVTDSARQVRMPAFELRNVRLSDIAHTIEFLGEGQLRVEVMENAGSGSVWLIGRNSSAEAADTVKMRSVAAPNLFADEKAMADIIKIAEELEVNRSKRAEVNGGARGVAQFARVEPLRSQKIFVITGGEEGVAGLESVIKAAESRLADAANANAAALAANGPRMRAVLAPHLFARDQRRMRLLETTERIQQTWANLNSELLKESGSDGSMAFRIGLPWVKVDPRTDQKVFVLTGTEAAIAGMESLIKAAEQLASEEDEEIERVARTKAAEAKAREEAAQKKEH